MAQGQNNLLNNAVGQSRETTDDASLEQLSASIERIRGKIDLVSEGIQGLTAGNKIFTIKSRASHFIECTYLTRIVHTESNS